MPVITHPLPADIGAELAALPVAWDRYHHGARGAIRGPVKLQDSRMKLHGLHPSNRKLVNQYQWTRRKSVCRLILLQP